MTSKDEALRFAITALANMVTVFTPNTYLDDEINDDAKKAIVMCKKALKEKNGKV